MAIAEGKEQSAMALTLRIMHLNFAAVSSTSIVSTNSSARRIHFYLKLKILPLAFNHLASRQDWQDEIAAEAQEIIDQEGWSFAALSRMPKLDSLVKEVMRFHHFSSSSYLFYFRGVLSNPRFP